jgi:hypothetical protein
MDQMFNAPFGMGLGGGMLGLEAGRGQQRAGGSRRGNNRQQLAQQQQHQLVSPDLFGFGGFGGMFQNMRRMMDDMHSTFVSASLFS